MRKWWLGVFTLPALFMLVGCNITLADQGELFFEFGTKIAMGHQASTTSSESQASLMFDQNVWDFIAPNEVDTDGDGVADTSTDESAPVE